MASSYEDGTHEHPQWTSHVTGTAAAVHAASNTAADGAGARRAARLGLVLGITQLLAQQAHLLSAHEQEGGAHGSGAITACGSIAPPDALSHPSGAFTGFHAGA